MPQESSSRRPQDSDDVLIEELLNGAEASHVANEQMLAKAKRFEKLLATGEAKFSGAKEFHAERVTDPGMAAEMDVNRALVLKGKEVAALLFKALHSSAEEAPAILSQLSEALRREGGLFERYDTVTTADQIARPEEYVYVRSGARVVNGDGEFGPFKYGAEMRTHIAPADKSRGLITKIPVPTDENAFYALQGQGSKTRAQDTAAEIRENPTQFAVIDDVYTYREEHNKHRVASGARKLTEEIIRGDINPNRPSDAQIKRYIANMFRLEGVEFDGDGEYHALAESVANEVSILMHACSSKYDAFLAWALPAEPIEIQFDGHDGQPHTAKLNLGWESVVLDWKS